MKRSAEQQSSLFRRLVLGFAAVVALVSGVAFYFVIREAQDTQRTRTAAENAAHTRELLLHLVEISDRAERIRAAAEKIEAVRTEMFRTLDYHSQVRMRVWQNGQLLYNSLPALPEKLPLTGDTRAHDGNTWVQRVESDAASGLVVERSHEVDDRWMFTLSGITFLVRSPIFSLPLMLLPAWFIVRLGLRPLRSFASAIEKRSGQDLTPLPASPYRELSPLVAAINHLMARLRTRIENEHQFLTDAAHELKTPLAAIQINAHLLQSRSAESDPVRHAEVGAGLREGVARANHAVQQLLALERAHADLGQEALSLQPLDVLVRDRLAAAAPLALQRGIGIDFQADDACARPLHQESMQALVDNLIGNAIKYSPEGGRIAVRLTPEMNGGCSLSFVDQGPGIPESLRQKVFERFFRIPGQEQGGSGLGLAIAERAAARNGARIRLEAGPEGIGLQAMVVFSPAL